MKSDKTIAIALIFFAMVGGALVFLYYQAFGYREIHLAGCSTAKPLVLSSVLAPTRADVFLWGSGREPVKLSVAHGSSVRMEETLVPDKHGTLSWSYHGDWYDDFVVRIEGRGCYLNLTYRL